MTPSKTKTRVGFAAALGLIALGIARPERPRLSAEPLLVDDPVALALIEDAGFGFARVVGRARLDTLARVVRGDVEELTRGAPKDSPRRPFDPSWLTRGRFELVGVVNRIDRRRFDPSACGEVRLVYRLAFAGAEGKKRRPVTRLPMTVNVRIPQPKPAGARDCASVAARWTSREDLVALLRDLPSPSNVEINYQSIHTPGTRADMDDSAEYVLRAFAFEADGLRVDHLFNTPRQDLDAEGRAALGAWVGAHLPEVDDGTAVVPDRWLATRAVSLSPRGLARAANRPFSNALAGAAIGASPSALADRALVVTPELLLRRLDEMTCAGCHQTRGVAGFHLLGEERDPRATFNALASGRSPHFVRDLVWRAGDIADVARVPAPRRPFASFPDGDVGADCGLVPGFAGWTCRPGLVCRDVHHAEVGVCARPRGQGTLPGDVCEEVTIAESERPEGPIVDARPADPSCPPPDPDEVPRGPFCAPNWLGFTGGMCTARCAREGEVTGEAVCAALPLAGYEADCFVGREPIEACLERHLATALVASCTRDRPCRGDYGCARVSQAPPGVGACVPPYFIFQARVDGPLLDR